MFFFSDFCYHVIVKLYLHVWICHWLDTETALTPYWNSSESCFKHLDIDTTNTHGYVSRKTCWFHVNMQSLCQPVICRIKPAQLWDNVDFRTTVTRTADITITVGKHPMLQCGHVISMHRQHRAALLFTCKSFDATNSVWTVGKLYWESVTVTDIRVGYVLYMLMLLILMGTFFVLCFIDLPTIELVICLMSCTERAKNYSQSTYLLQLNSANNHSFPYKCPKMLSIYGSLVVR